jgi:hypothetical protein
LTGDFFTILLEMMKQMGHQIVFKKIITPMDLGQISIHGYGKSIRSSKKM